MNKELLKDGMMVISKNGNRRLIFNNAENYINMETKAKEVYGIEVILTGDGDLCPDQIKVVYMGETIWERKEYLTFIEAAKTGKRFKHKDVSYYSAYISQALDALEDFFDEDEEDIEIKELIKRMFKEMDDKVWEVEGGMDNE